MHILVRNLRLTRDRDWLNETMDRADRTTWMCYVIASGCGSCHGSP